MLGEDHPDTLNLMNNLGGLLKRDGKPSEAEPYFREALTKSRRVLGDEHPDTLHVACNLSTILLAQGNFGEAVDLLGPAEPAARKVFTGAYAPRLALFLSTLGHARSSLPFDPGRFGLAQANLLEARSIYVATPGERHESILKCTHLLVDLYTAWDKTEPGKGYDAKAAEWKAKVDALTAPAPEAVPAEKK